ncbi:UDP-N-acetylmuramoyl-tripeptide--D-alanyl-D-alanine ligase [Kangiella koreensis]|uniref:UDP-N-acetylmuramoyl-tripeptide--D-alanyl-D-alanine ligase n=1 Tax=Kangiella koreensis (strain DSM 16069 / JCM 12317 / KCTC 12182 / SW-125) TaxID=523791 RepID=C7R9L4_KANKD|nr:UDP-N-acetylmuramoyl-tripeptide--D-alanyl-D-alanine ligase [Kangiella koreensis]ACV26105.1 UDP-N-acetylmuramoylalanyl-D-glutamyl-2,6-diamin opimelate/D-alanyl-D-alanylligase [Kangiella koreensis DSM 16069]
MIPLSLTTIAEVAKGTLQGSDIIINKVITDSRVDCRDALFIALKGENFDGHQFVEKAKLQGAKALLVEHLVESNLPQVIVSDTEKALGLVAKYVRDQVNPLVIGITGSAGKTTVKEMVASILRQKGNLLATQGNFNNHIGVPLTLLRLKETDQYAVIEMGANHIGEIAYCASLAKPDVSVINNVEAAHIEGFGSVEGVAKAKSEIYQALSEEGTAVINLDSNFADQWIEQFAGLQKITVSRHKDANFVADNCQTQDNGNVIFTMQHTQDGNSQSISVQLPVPGMHNVSNALVAAALASAAGADMEIIKVGLETMVSVKGRLNQFKAANGALIIDDTYNASVASVKAAIDYLTSLSGTKVLVLGDMAELGDESEQYHREVGEYAKENNISQLLVSGHWVKYSTEAFGDKAQWFENKELLVSHLNSVIQSDYKILVKGSRSAQMEQVVDALVAVTADESNLNLGGDS